MNDKAGITVEQMNELLNKAPKFCLITGLEKCESYLVDGKVVYTPRPAYDAYTLPDYDEKERAFYRTKYDMDDDFREEYEHLCDLEELDDHSKLEDIKNFYNIK